MTAATTWPVTMADDGIVTYEMAHRAGWDAGNRNMRAAGRDRWTEDDWDVAAATMNRLLDAPHDPAMLGGAS